MECTQKFVHNKKKDNIHIFSFEIEIIYKCFHNKTRDDVWYGVNAFDIPKELMIFDTFSTHWMRWEGRRKARFETFVPLLIAPHKITRYWCRLC